MDPRDRIRIKKNLKNIIDDLLVQDIIPILIQEGTLSINDSEIIEHEITKRNQAFKLIQLVITRGPNAYNTFRKSLLETHEHLVQLLDETIVTEEDLLNLDGNDGKQMSSDTLHILRNELKTQYLAQLNCINPVPWLDCFQVNLDQVYTSLKIVRGINRSAFHKAVFEEQKYDYTLGSADIFKANEASVNPKHILIEGEPGIGKSVMCCKLCYDWAKDGHSAEHSIHKFDLIFIIQAKELELRTPVLDSIYHQLLPEDFTISKKDFKECVSKHVKKSLIIVDGYDELMEQHVDLNKIIQGKALSQISLLLTSRPGYALNMMKHFDSIFINIGYDEQRRFQFIDKFSKEIGPTDSVAVFKDFKCRLKADNVLNELCRNPLNLSILCMLVAETNLELPNTKTALYEELRKFIVQRASVTLDFDAETLEEKCKPLEVIAYEGVVQGRQQVTETDVCEVCNVDILQHLGFFCKEVTVSRFKRVATYTFTHKSFQEYFAAKYLARPKRTRQERKELASEILQIGANSLVIVFLCGLLKDKKESLLDLFDVLKSETFLPLVPCDKLGLHDVSENHRGHMIFHCLNEIAPIPPKLGPQVIKCLVDQVSISYPWCSEECVDGLLRYCEQIDEHCQFCKLLRDINTSVKKLNIKENGSVVKNNNNDFSFNKMTTYNKVISRPNTLMLSDKPTTMQKHLNQRPVEKSPHEAWSTDRSSSVKAKSPPEPISLKDEANILRRQSTIGWIQSHKSGKSKSFDMLDGPVKSPSKHDLTPMTEQLLETYSKKAKSKSHDAVIHKNVPAHHGQSRSNHCNKFSVTVPGQFAIERPSLFDKLVTNILNCRHVNCLGMHNITSVEQLQELFTVLAKIGRPRMTALKLKFHGILESKEAKFNPVYFLWIQSLSILDCSSASILQQLINDIPSASTIRYLTLQNCLFNESALHELNTKLQSLKCLKKFEFIQNTVPRDEHLSIASVLKALENHRRLGVFSISHLPSRIEKPLQLAEPRKNESAANLKVVESLFPMKDETSHFFTPHLCEIIEKNKLTDLNISNTSLGEGILHVITDTLDGKGQLEKFHLRHCHIISHMAMDQLLQSKDCKRLTELNLLETELSMESFQVIAQILMSTKKLTKLVLSVYNSAAVNLISKGLQLNCTLVDLVLTKILLNEENTEPLANALTRHPTLKCLHMSSNDMASVQLSFLFSALRTAKTLECLTLKDFGLEDLHMIEFARVLSVNTQISEVDLQKNGIGQSGADLLYKALLFRTKLLSLNLSDNRAKEHHHEVQLLKTRVLYLKVNWF